MLQSALALCVETSLEYCNGQRREFYVDPNVFLRDGYENKIGANVFENHRQRSQPEGEFAIFVHHPDKLHVAFNESHWDALGQNRDALGQIRNKSNGERVFVRGYPDSSYIPWPALRRGAHASSTETIRLCRRSEGRA